MGRKRSEPPEEMKKFLAIKLLEHLASNLVYSWDNIKPPMQLGERNPVVEQGMAKVLCLACYGKNDQDFKFCKFCAMQAGEGCLGKVGERVLGTDRVIDTFEEEVAEERRRFNEYRANKSTNKRSMVVTKLFEEFIHSRGLHKHRAAGVNPVSFSVLDVDDTDVLEFLMFKNVSGTGKTFVHAQNCEHLGSYQEYVDCREKGCGRFHAAESMRSGTISMLRKGLTTLGLIGDWNQEKATGNPAASVAVKQYQLMLREEQARAGVTQRSAALLMREDIVRLLQRMSAWLMNPALSQDEKYEMMRDMAYIAVVFATGRRCDDMANLLISQMVRFPDGRGIMFGFQFGKTLRDGSRNMFGLRRDDITPEICAVRLMDDLDEYATKVGIRREGNKFFTKIKNGRRLLENIPTDYMTERLRKYMKKAGMEVDQGRLSVSIHSLRAGGPLNKMLEGDSLKKVMFEAYWKNPKTAWKYIKLLEVMGPFEYDRASISPEEYARLNTLPMNEHKAWVRAYK